MAKTKSLIHPSIITNSRQSAIVAALVTALLLGLTACGRQTSIDTSSNLNAHASKNTLGALSIEISANHGPVGTILRITGGAGVNFSTVKSVTIGSVASIPIDSTSQTLTAYVMPGAVTGPVIVTDANGHVLRSKSNFRVVRGGIPTAQSVKLMAPDLLSAKSELGTSVSMSADGHTALVGAYGQNGNVGAALIYGEKDGSWTRQMEIVASDSVGLARFGSAVSLSADGNTALIGGEKDNNEVGAAWIFVRSNGVWKQQAKLVGTDVIGATSNQGYALGLSADGNTAIVGGYNDNSAAGASWIFVRQGTTWSQEAKLIGTGGTGLASEQGGAVGISADGNTVIIGGDIDSSSRGACWIFNRTGTTWKQTAELVSKDAIGTANQGSAVALNADGTVAIVGGFGDNSETGAAWIFTNKRNLWTEQAKLIGSKMIGKSFQGVSVSINAAGTVALVGGPKNNSYAGGVWLFEQFGDTWREGAFLLGGGTVGHISQQGFSISLSANGSTALVGAPGDTDYLGAVWIFSPATTSHRGRLNR